MVSFPQEVLLVDATSILHPFSTHRLDAGPIRLTTIAHAFNYRMAVLRDGVKSAARVGRSRRAEGRILCRPGRSVGSSIYCYVSNSVCTGPGGAYISSEHCKIVECVT